MTSESRSGSLHLGVALAGGGVLRLCLDDPRGTEELAGPADSLPPGSFLVVDGAAPVVVEEDGVFLVPRGLFWSLLCPTRPDAADPPTAEDHLDAERQLRHEGRLFWEGIAAWRDLAPDLLRTCRGQLAG